MVHAATQRSSNTEYRLKRALDRHGAAPLALALKRRRLGAYRGYAEMLGALRELSKGGAALEAIGESVTGEPILAVTIGNRDSKRTSIVLSGLHPMEWISIETNLALLQRLAQRPMSDRRVVAVPMANPDGIIEVERNLRLGRRRLVRFNRSGVDLNRNFPVHWNRLSLSRLMLGRYRPGSAPASEPEVRAITAFLTGSMVDRALSLHSFGGAVLHPYGARLRPPLDVTEHRRWARHIAERADTRNPYRVVQCSHWLPGFTAPGMELDYFHDQHGALSLLVECTRGGLSARSTSLRRCLEPFAWYNPERLDNYAPQIAGAVEPFVRGLVQPA
ncbi:MAG TPA: M14 family metallopeptidase [Polyangiaceae bacterium]|nr:M14 family metallopeptidase [Polyangiaceae bacterium]